MPWASTESAERSESPGTERDDEWDRPQRRRQPAPRHDPNYCLNHPDTASQHICVDCGEAFCADCVVALQGQMLCGPCKNFRIRGLHQPVHPSGLAIGSVILGLIGGPFAYCLAIVSPAMMMQGSTADVANSPAAIVTMTLIGLLVPGLALFLGVLALRRIETDPQVGGRSLAMTGLVTGVAGVLFCLAVVLIVVLHAGPG